MLVSGTLSAPQGQVEGLSVYNAVDGQRVLVMSRFLSSISDRRSKKIYKQESAVRGMIFKHISETFAIIPNISNFRQELSQASHQISLCFFNFQGSNASLAAFL